METAGPARAGERRGWARALGELALGLVTISGSVAGIAAAVVILTTMLASVTGVMAGPLAAVTSDPPCAHAVGPFTVHGTQVLAADGKPFISYGITVPDMQGPHWARDLPLDLEKVGAIADVWCANTVRFQLDQDNLNGPYGTSFDPAYMKAIESLVSESESDGLVVVLNDSTEFAPNEASLFQRGPTPSTEVFWKDMAAVYGHDPQVIFDLFNEPRMYHPGMSLAEKWQLWLNGGEFAGVFYPFGMAGLADYVRNTVGARNVFWVEGPRYSLGFAGMVTEGAVLHTSGIVYAAHHTIGAVNTNVWYAEFAYLVVTGVAPMVIGEWTNYEPAPTNSFAPAPGSCWPRAWTLVPKFLNYLAAHGIGLDVYQLQAGYMIKSWNDMGDPTTINPSTWSCLQNNEPQPDQGAGTLVMNWFIKQNS